MTEYASRGDPRRSMELLWGAGQAPTAARSRVSTSPTIVAAAIELADADGLAAVSMRRRRRAAREERDGAVHLRPGQGRTARPDARHRLRRAADRATRSTPGGGPPSRRRPATAGRSTSATRGCCRSSGARPCSVPARSTLYESPAAPVRRPRADRRRDDARGRRRRRFRPRRGQGGVRRAHGRAGDRRQRRRLVERPLAVPRARCPPTCGRRGTRRSSRLSEEHAFDQLDRPDDEHPVHWCRTPSTRSSSGCSASSTASSTTSTRSGTASDTQ